MKGSRIQGSEENLEFIFPGLSLVRLRRASLRTSQDALSLQAERRISEVSIGSIDMYERLRHSQNAIPGILRALKISPPYPINFWFFFSISSSSFFR